jgi:phosphoribosylaminoimidazolecarboxamide formyltransferase/IMP cyclohydrolase
LLSVSDKTYLPEFARRLRASGVDVFLSTSGTARLLRENGIEVQEVYEHANFAEVLGRLITNLSRQVSARLPGPATAPAPEEVAIPLVDMVVSNLYAADQVVSAPGMDLVSSGEDINIDGPTLIRAAAKNHSHVAVVTNPARYDAVAREMEASGGALSAETRFDLALEAFRHTAHYDTCVARYMAGIKGEQMAEPERLTLQFIKKRGLPHGENPQQTAALYTEEHVREPCVSNACHIGGPELSFHGVISVDAGINLVREFGQPAVALIRNGCPYGAAEAEYLSDAVRKACPGALTRCALVMNRDVDVETAKAVTASVSSGMLEALVAPSFDAEAVEILHSRASWLPQVTLLATGPLEWRSLDREAFVTRGITGGLLVQSRNLAGFHPESLSVVTEVRPSAEQMAELGFAWLCCKHGTSHAVVLVSNRALLAVGAGQPDAEEAARIALRRAGEMAAGSVLAADAPWESLEAFEQVGAAGVAAVIQPGGSGSEADLIVAADRLGMAMVLTGTPQFRH